MIRAITIKAKSPKPSIRAQGCPEFVFVLAIAVIGGCHSNGNRLLERSAKAERQLGRRTDLAHVDRNGSETRSHTPSKDLLRLESNPSSLRTPGLPATVPGSQLRTPALQKHLQTVGRRLAQVFPREDIRFEFDSLNNPRPRTHHTSGGNIYVTTGMLAELEGVEELAIVLSLEMAELIIERSQAEESVAESIDSVGGNRSNPDANRVESQEPTKPERINHLAQQLLKRAGYSQDRFTQIRSELMTIPRTKSALPTAPRVFGN